jgi:hypothetical protein
MNIGSVVRVWRAEPLTESVPGVLGLPVDAPVADHVDAVDVPADAPVPAER